MPIAGAFIYEFLYRGRAPGDAEPPAYHLILGTMKAPPFSDVEELATSDTMNVEQAIAAGYPLTEILAEINADTLAHNDAQSTQISDLTGELEQANEDLQSRASEISARDSQIETLNASIAQLKDDAASAAEQIDALTQSVADKQKQIDDLEAQINSPQETAAE